MACHDLLGEKAPIVRATLVNSAAPIVRQFSTPFEPFDSKILDTVVVSHAISACKRFLAVHSERIEANSTGLLECLDYWLSSRIDLDSAWSLAVGQAAYADDPCPHSLQIAVGLGLLAARGGHSTAWEARGYLKTPLLFGDYVLPPSQGMQLQSDGSLIELELKADNDQIAIHRLATGGIEWHCSLHRLPAISPNNRLLLLERTYLPTTVTDCDTLVGFSPLVDVEPKALEPFLKSLKLLSALDGGFDIWATRLVRALTLYDRSSLRSGSASRIDMPGIVACSIATDPTEIAETLIHEASHQHFYVAERVGPCCNRDHHALYFSPPVGRERPLKSILMAYHAFANVLLLYAQMISKGFDRDGRINRQKLALQPQVDHLQATLESVTALTDLGRSIFLPLRARLA